MAGLTLHKLRDSVSTLAIPLLSACGLGLGWRLITAASSSKSFETIVIASLLLVCAAILLWWLLSVIYLLTAAGRAKKSGFSLSLPPWIPRFMRNAVFAAVGLGALSSPAYAATAPAAVVQTQVSEDITPFFNLDESQEQEAAPQTGAETMTLVVSQEEIPHQHTPLTPFFQLASPAEPVSAAAPLSCDTPGSQDQPLQRVVLAGDSLWSIAQEMKPDATDAQILETVSAIFQANRATLDSPDTTIYPGQILMLPSAK